MATAVASPKSEVLNSWKEIASYLGRGVRTVQRYERELNLPVRRPHGKSRSAVIALTEDLDRWLHAAPTSERQNGKGARPIVRVSMIHETVEQSQDLRYQLSALRMANREQMDKLVLNLASLMEGIHANSRLKKSGGGLFFLTDGEDPA